MLRRPIKTLIIAYGWLFAYMTVGWVANALLPPDLLHWLEASRLKLLVATAIVVYFYKDWERLKRESERLK